MVKKGREDLKSSQWGGADLGFQNLLETELEQKANRVGLWREPVGFLRRNSLGRAKRRTAH